MSALDIKSRPSGHWRSVARAGAMLLLVIIELAALDANYSFRAAVEGEPTLAWRLFNDGVQIAIYAGFYAALAFCVLMLARAKGAGVEPAEKEAPHRGRFWLGAHLILFAALLMSLPLIQSDAGRTPWLALTIWLIGGAMMIACAAVAVAPFRFWRRLLMNNGGALFAAGCAGLCTWAAVELAQNSWHHLSAATLHGAFHLLRLYEPQAFMDASTRILGAGEFRVTIDAPCSGYEGVGLVVTMLSVYIFAFRRDLRFPHVLALLPLGALFIWLLNLLRLAMLVSIGAHVSPTMALDGFHSQAGWIMFIVATIAMMAIAHHVPALRRDAKAAPRIADPGFALALALLAPFAALMLARIGGAVAGDESRWLGPALIALPAFVLWLYRHRLRQQLGAVGWEPLLIGAAVGLLWVVTEPRSDDAALGSWLADQGSLGAALWLALRIFGFALVVPVAEELAFRGYLHRALIKRRFEEAAPAAFSWTALIVTSLLFGALHGRWLAGALAGAAFALTLYRSRSLSGPIAAHITANGLIAAWALLAGRWDLL